MAELKTPYTVRIPADVKKWIHNLADKNLRSMNSEIIVQLRACMELTAGGDNANKSC